MPGEFWRTGERERPDIPLQAAWLFLWIFLAAWSEATFAAFGLVVPSAPILCLLVGIAMGPLRGFFAGLLALAFIEASLGRADTAAPLILLVSLLAWHWRKHGDRIHAMLCIPGFFLGGLYALYLLLFGTSFSALPNLLTSSKAMMILALACCLGAIILPLAGYTYDALARRLDLPTFLRE